MDALRGTTRYRALGALQFILALAPCTESPNGSSHRW